MSFADSPHQEADTHGIYTREPHTDERFDHVMCFGTFDIFHPGHEFYLSQSQKFAHKMTVVIARDHRVFSGKWRDPVHDESVRLQSVQSVFPTAHVILGDERDIFAPIRELHPDLLAFGYDQRVPEDKIRELFPDITIVRIGGHETEKWKSSLLRRDSKFKIQN
jgi:FAD synthetase